MMSKDASERLSRRNKDSVSVKSMNMPRAAVLEWTTKELCRCPPVSDKCLGAAVQEWRPKERKQYQPEAEESLGAAVQEWD